MGATVLSEQTSPRLGGSRSYTEMANWENEVEWLAARLAIKITATLTTIGRAMLAFRSRLPSRFGREWRLARP